MFMVSLVVIMLVIVAMMMTMVMSNSLSVSFPFPSDYLPEEGECCMAGGVDDENAVGYIYCSPW